MLDTNLNGSFLFAREAGKYWIDNKMKGNLILVSSMSSIICVRPQKQAAYNAVRDLATRLATMIGNAYFLAGDHSSNCKQSKAAVSLLGRSLATEVRPTFGHQTS
jgi:NAD(P)-dependent dehydrogenase (short-subunit alcohol dehydrogenase family)